MGSPNLYREVVMEKGCFAVLGVYQQGAEP